MTAERWRGSTANRNGAQAVTLARAQKGYDMKSQSAFLNELDIWKDEASLAFYDAWGIEAGRGKRWGKQLKLSACFVRKSTE